LDPETAVIHFLSPGGVRRRPQRPACAAATAVVAAAVTAALADTGTAAAAAVAVAADAPVYSQFAD